MKTDKILIVDDEASNRALLEARLEVLGYESRSAASGPVALEMLDESIDLVLLDVNMPAVTGFDVARQIRAAATCSDVPIIMVTALSSMQDRLTAIEAGANDFICKPIDSTELRIRVASQLRVKHGQDAVKLHHQELESKVDLRTAALREANDRLERLATTDAVTGLPNHRSLMTSLEAEIELSHASGSPCGILFIDLDHFKALNDACGHAIGDAVLTEFGVLLERMISPIGTCGRWGGEEFVCILPHADSAKARESAEEVRLAVAQNLFQAGAGCHVTCSIGVASFPLDGHDRSTIAEIADKAMYVAKSLGRNQVRTAQDVLSGFGGLHVASSSREDVALEGLVEALAALVNARDEYAGNHTDDGGGLASQLAAALGLDAKEIRLVGLVSKLHDIGKVAIPDSILQKPGPLTTDELVLVRLHPVIGSEIIGRVPTLRMIAAAIRGHHERWDGSGYPDGLAGEAIPLASRIVAVADTYSAMTTDRPYRKGRSHETAVAELYKHCGTQFCPRVIGVLDEVFRETKSALIA